MARARSLAPRVLLAAIGLALAAFLSPAAQAAGPGGGFYYTFQYGDSFQSLSSRFGIPVHSIMAANGLRSPYAFVGRSIYMPGGYGPAYAGYQNSGTYYRYDVQPGDTLPGIAWRYGVSAYALMHANHLYSPGYLYPHMRMYIPRYYGYGQPGYSGYPGSYGYYGAPGYSSPTYSNYQTYVVQPGDTLTGIALRFGTTVYALEVANNIANPNLIYIGMRLTIAGSGSSGYPYGGYPPAPGVTPTPGPTPTPGATGTMPVTIVNMSFNPRVITVHAGSVVVWTNKDSVQHTVTSGTPGSPNGTFDSGTLNPGQTYQFTFANVGTYPYYCRIHGAAMTGIVYVVP